MKNKKRRVLAIAAAAALLVSMTATFTACSSEGTAPEVTSAGENTTPIAADSDDMPEIVAVEDPAEGVNPDDGIVVIGDDGVPLAGSIVKTKTTTKTSTRKINMASKAKKNQTTTSKKTSTKSNTKTTAKEKIKTDTTVLTTTVTTLKKASAVKTEKTTVKTTVKTTTTDLTNSSALNTMTTVRKIAPKAHSNVLKAYESLNFKVVVNSGVGFSGRFDARNQIITLKKNTDEAIYHELGHFVGFLAGNMDSKSEFTAIFNKEKGKFKGTRNNDSYILSSQVEYFAESYQDYVENPSGLKKSRPQTYDYIAKAVEKITDSRVSLIKKLYANIWK